MGNWQNREKKISKRRKPSGYKNVDSPQKDKLEKRLIREAQKYKNDAWDTFDMEEA